MAVEVTTDYPMFIDGASSPSDGGRWLEVHNPATGEVVGRVPGGHRGRRRSRRRGGPGVVPRRALGAHGRCRSGSRS